MFIAFCSLIVVIASVAFFALNSPECLVCLDRLIKLNNLEDKL